MSLYLETSQDQEQEQENPSTFRQIEEKENEEDNKKLGNLEAEKSLTISSGDYGDLPSPMNNESKEKINFDKNVSEINFGRRYDDNLKSNKNRANKNEEFLKFIADNSGNKYLFKTEDIIFGGDEKKEPAKELAANLGVDNIAGRNLIASNNSVGKADSCSKVIGNNIVGPNIGVNTVKVGGGHNVGVNNMDIVGGQNTVVNNANVNVNSNANANANLEMVQFSLNFIPSSENINNKLLSINKQLKDKLGIYEVQYKEVIDEFTKLQTIYKELENFYLETFNLLFKK